MNMKKIILIALNCIFLSQTYGAEEKNTSNAIEFYLNDKRFGSLTRTKDYTDPFYVIPENSILNAPCHVENAVVVLGDGEMIPRFKSGRSSVGTTVSSPPLHNASITEEKGKLLVYDRSLEEWSEQEIIIPATPTEKETALSRFQHSAEPELNIDQYQDMSRLLTEKGIMPSSHQLDSSEIRAVLLHNNIHIRMNDSFPNGYFLEYQETNSHQ